MYKQVIALLVYIEFIFGLFQSLLTQAFGRASFQAFNIKRLDSSQIKFTFFLLERFVSITLYLKCLDEWFNLFDISDKETEVLSEESEEAPNLEQKIDLMETRSAKVLLVFYFVMPFTATKHNLINAVMQSYMYMQCSPHTCG